jgi:fatty-acyl-CoA synthase
MKLAFSNLACPLWSIERAADAARSLGYDALELRLLDGEVIDPLRDRERVREATAICRALGVEVCAFDSSCSFNHAAVADRERNVEDLLAWIRLAADVSVPIVRVFGGQGEPDEDAATANARVAEALRLAAPEAEAAGITVALETHDAFSSAHRVAEVLAQVSSPRIAALWDSHHPYRMGESAEEVADVLGSRIAHVHVKDATRTDPEGTTWQLVLLGEGEVPVAEQLRVLRQRGYEGYVSVEWEKKWHPEIPDPEVALPQHIRYLRSLIGRSTGVDDAERGNPDHPLGNER